MVNAGAVVFCCTKRSGFLAYEIAFASSGGPLGCPDGGAVPVGLFCSAEDDTDLPSFLPGFELQATVNSNRTDKTHSGMDRPSLMVNLSFPAKPDSTNVPEAGSTRL